MVGSEGEEARNHEIRAEALRVFHRMLDLDDAHIDDAVGAAVTAALDAVRCAQGRDTDAPESDVDRLANDLAGDWRERAERAEADVTMWKTRLVGETARLRELLRAARSPQGEDHEAEVDRLRAGISFVRGLCTDRASYSVIDERLGELLDGETT